MWHHHGNNQKCERTTLFRSVLIRITGTMSSLFSVDALVADASAIGDSLCHPEQEGRAKQGSYKRPEDTISIQAEQTQNDAAQQTAYDSYENISQNAQFIPLNPAVGQRSGKPADHNPDEPCPERTKDASQHKCECHCIPHPFLYRSDVPPHHKEGHLTDLSLGEKSRLAAPHPSQIGRASCRER